MKIWIDIVNSPHVLFFRPIIKTLVSRGENVIVTSRSFGHTEELLDKFGIKYISFDKHRGSSLINKISGLFSRTFELIKFAKEHKFDLALAHNSSDLAIASKFLGIPSVSMFDYEFAYSHHITIRCSSKVIFPDFIKIRNLLKYGIQKKVVFKYRGLKEQMYLSNYKYDKNVLSKLNIDQNKVIITIRPPAFHAHYHLNHTNELFWKLIKKLDNVASVQTLLLPRDSSQLNFFQRQKFKKIKIISKTVDGPSLISHSDVVVSGGGTMNREAVALGTKVFTVFSLNLGGIDKFLIEKGLLEKLDEDMNIPTYKQKKGLPLKSTSPDVIVDQILNFES